jgi:ATP-binding cassette, subfamily C (CFTR/MRP), member 1
MALACIRLVSLIFWAQTKYRNPSALAAAAITVATTLPICALSYYEHTFNVAPSIVLSFYLLLTVIFDIAKVRSLWLIDDVKPLAVLESLALVATITLAIAETKTKKTILLSRYRGFTWEQLSGLYGRSLFLWLRELLWHGEEYIFHIFLR